MSIRRHTPSEQHKFYTEPGRTTTPRAMRPRVQLRVCGRPNRVTRGAGGAPSALAQRPSQSWGVGRGEIDLRPPRPSSRRSSGAQVPTTFATAPCSDTPLPPHQHLRRKRRQDPTRSSPDFESGARAHEDRSRELEKSAPGGPFPAAGATERAKVKAIIIRHVASRKCVRAKDRPGRTLVSARKTADLVMPNGQPSRS